MTEEERRVPGNGDVIKQITSHIEVVRGEIDQVRREFRAHVEDEMSSGINRKLDAIVNGFRYGLGIDVMDPDEVRAYADKHHELMLDYRRIGKVVAAAVIAGAVALGGVVVKLIGLIK